jgi:surface antigen
LGFFVDLEQGVTAASAAEIAPVNHAQGSEMSTPIRAVVLFAAIAACLPARAQYLGPGLETNIELTKQDLDIMRSTVDRQVHGKPVGTAASWSNPASGNYGKIVLEKTYLRDGRPCETVEYTVATRRRPVRPEHYVLNSCQLPDGQWRIT